jgi:hypothetical protein
MNVSSGTVKGAGSVPEVDCSYEMVKETKVKV